MSTGKNDPCPCGSGKKFKHCCEGKSALPNKRMAAPSPEEINPLVTLFNTRRYAELESQARALLDRYPKSGFVWKLLGAALQMQGKEALPAFLKTAELMPTDAEAHFNLGVVQKGLGQLEDAAASYRRALKIKPDYAEAHNNLGNTLRELGQLEDATVSYRRALKLQPNYVDTHFNLGNTLKDLGRLDEAIISLRRAAELNPALVAAHNNLGATFKELGRLDEAVSSYRRAIELDPTLATAYSNLGAALQELQRFPEAVSSYQRALQLRPDYAEAHCNLGIAMKKTGRFDEAVACYRRAAELQPDYALARSELGGALKDLGLIDEALVSFRQAVQLKPDSPEMFSNLLFTMNYANLSPAACLVEARRYGQLVTSKATAPFTTWMCDAQPERLRVGVVSGDLNLHPVGYFLESLLPQINPDRIELIAYPSDAKCDVLTTRIQPFFKAWKPIVELSDADAAKLIHADGVHVLLDLSGHTGKNRLPVFAWRPAPAQASWLGYFATTGVAEMDFLLADETGVPEQHHAHFTEAIRYLPDTRLCFSAPQADVPVSTLPALKSGHITFGCFQNLAKIGNSVLALWADILNALPDARLRLQSKQLIDTEVAAQLVTRLGQHGINPTRVALHGFSTRATYLAAHAEVDILLDTFPFPGGTTTCEALWMGVPTVTLAGDTLIFRQGASLLSASGLNEWITNTPSEYVERTVALASDLPKLSALRATLREQVLTSPLFDAPRFARNFEKALWGMWRDKTRQTNNQ